ncbi:MAG TPA: cyclophilin-like fold protein [Patescibacteria group bacterium]|nr:cyclophilin-like fold protein [Patescibacteria group bacterium]
MMDIVIRSGDIFLTAQLDDNETARRIAAILPITSEAGLWGEEVFFEIPLTCRLAPDARDLMQPGEIAFWPPGRSLCVFWGETPSSRKGEIRAASPVNPIGRVTGDVTVLGRVRDGDVIVVERA